MSPTLNGSSVIQCFEYGDMLEKGDGISYEVEIGLVLPGITQGFWLPVVLH